MNTTWRFFRLWRPATAVLLALLALQAPVSYAAAVSVVDDSGKRIELPHPATRVVSLYAAFSEMLADMGAAGQIAGKTAADQTAGTEQAVAVGTHMRPNIELIAALQPDLVVLLDGREQAAVAAGALEDLGIPVARFSVHSFESLFACFARLGVLTGREAEAEEVVSSMRGELAEIAGIVQRQALRPRVFFEVRYPNLLGAGTGSIVDDIIRAAGGVNVLAGHQEKMVRLNEEVLLAYDPDVYLLQQGSMNKNPVPLESRPHFAQLQAVLQKRSYVVDESIFSRPGRQNILAVRILLHYFYPDVEAPSGAVLPPPKREPEPVALP